MIDKLPVTALLVSHSPYRNRDGTFRFHYCEVIRGNPRKYAIHRRYEISAARYASLVSLVKSLGGNWQLRAMAHVWNR